MTTNDQAILLRGWPGWMGSTLRRDVRSLLDEALFALRPPVVVTSDGLFDNLYTGEIVECLRRGTLSDSVQDLANECHARMGRSRDDQPSKPEDFTVLVYRLS